MGIIREIKPTILIVDDATTNIELLSELLCDEYSLKIAKNGQKALEIANSDNKPDLILLDVIMPGINGYEVCKKLKSNLSTQNIPIIFVTGNDSPIDEEYGLNLGAVDYIKKPFNPSIAKIRVKNHIKLKLKSDALEELSMCDALTHIPNRRYFEERYDVKYKEALRENISLSVMMIDIDYFKQYNDNYGHGRGDDVLTKVAITLKNTLKRPSDMIARYGGEEFVAILKDTTVDGAKKVATEMIETIKNLKISHKYSQISEYITISIGISHKNIDEDKSKNDILLEADKALYKAKESGRDRYEIYN